MILILVNYLGCFWLRDREDRMSSDVLSCHVNFEG